MAGSQSSCSVDECTRPKAQRSMCWTHYERLRKHGSLEPRSRPCAYCEAKIVHAGTSGPLPKFCSAECKRSSRRKPGPVDGRCEGCGGQILRDNRTRNLRYCHPNCRHIRLRNPERPRSVACAQCGVLLEMSGRDDSGRLTRKATKLRCAECSRIARPHRYGMTARQVADRDGAICRWCDEMVDFSLVGTRSKWAPSVDHIIPWSRGGTNHPTNLQLLHRVCNAQKGTKLP